ncbi:DNA topoisomerase I [candidate division WOR-1 bacterium RIFOXYB2_FULL_42_35]|uniref:DNA topoisomerase 1 n=1 Tax=candidate division WOR-1 bacterium RIFOXYC2_FULL_41_25 TaxID=1802586 RepID=A0A1F4TRH9_UNCSA|nr:MAG: DNA topoisomerase I [candidate division WOR-1 bacterium RIFOXYA2_FULL_41_14]OGC25818.1 MAG: DNA topoisomerase I [candidate division WOR-1 bacterium RIFOXYB2_FULL_42_35]OGC35258.1 MAG: DNA topoisomerase I [candidate division WOR-1 bacterium RIFOXYC2_FULL_41_25]
MTKKLVIVESPAKAKTLKKFLGNDYVIEACAGHIRDLPAKSLGVKVEKDFEPNYKIIKTKEKIIKHLKAAAAKADIVFLAPDPDREGEAIAWHLKYLLDKNKNIKRIEFHEITKEAVTKAVKNPREIDMGRVNAQQARRILDRLVGYKISPLLWKKVRKGLSAGRVQSVAVRLICEREEQVKAFNPQEYWDIIAQLETAEKKSLSAKLIAKADKPLGVNPKDKGRVVVSQIEADKIVKDLERAQYTVTKIERKEQKRYPAPPFITSTLQQEASRKLGFSAKRTMMIAQKLYEGISIKGEDEVGLITYMRTDSVRLADEAEVKVREYISESFGQEYLPEQIIKYKKKKQAQDAHEAIRPTSALRHPEKIKDSLSPDEFKLYDLIWKRFVACQMNPAVFDRTSLDIMAKDYKFRANGSVIKFDGFIKLYLEGQDEEDAEEKEGFLPELKEEEILSLLELLPAQHFTQPPPRYTEASLVKELEKRGIGRPSTYAPIMATIQDRGYVEKEGKALKPTEIGITTNGLLVKHFPKILNIKFTAGLEDQLDDILEGKKDWIEILHEFYEPFALALKEADQNMEKIKTETMTKEVCPKCGKFLVIRDGRFGKFYACSGYPKCKHTRPLEEEKAPSDEKCPKCGRPMVLKHSRFGSFLACSGYPQCKSIKSIIIKIDVKCPDCDGELTERRTRRGKVFYGCSNYPKCKYATWQRPATPTTAPPPVKKETEDA